MKKIIIILIIFGLSQGIQAQNTYWWYNGSQKELTTMSKKMFVLVNNANDTTIAKNQIMSKGHRLDFFKEIIVSALPFKSSMVRDTNYWTTVEITNDQYALSNINIDYWTPSFLTQSGIVIGLSHLFYVKLNSLNDIELLERIALENNVSILGNNQYLPLWFTLSCTKESTGNALQMANFFYESNLFSASEPDFLVDDSPMCVNDDPLCVNDPYFSNQWGLNNTGQNNGIVGIDINYCSAQQITTGDTNIIVAVLDTGVELDHSDLPNMHPLSFDTESLSSPSLIFSNHGTACAGIIGATINNDLGIAGIAPNTTIMSISNSLTPNPDSRTKRADGIMFACNNGASVISNSWRSGVGHSIIDDAINYALTQGRNEKVVLLFFLLVIIMTRLLVILPI